MLALKEYENAKKAYIKLNNLSSDNIYNYFESERILLLIRRYYEVYTKFLFNKLMGSLRLEVSPEKAEKLAKLKGLGSWEFAGMIDMYDRGKATCELGHPIRYVYKAVNTENGQTLNFGSRCVGDFFDLDSQGLKALIKVKDEMFLELKDIVSIKNQNLMDEHYKYDCGELGLIIKATGLKGIEKLKGLNPLMPIVYDFVANQLPLPKSLLNQVLFYKKELNNKLSDLDFLDIDKENLEILKNSEISLISTMFTTSYSDIIENIKLCRIGKYQSDFYNFRTISDFNIAISHWINRNERILKAQDYFKNQGIKQSWLDIYKYMIYNRLYRENPKIYYGVELLLVFDRNINIESTMYMPKEYGYKGYKLSPKAYEDFDDLINYLASKEFYMAVKEVNDLLGKDLDEKAKESEIIEGMMDYLKNNLMDDKYSSLKGILGVRDIVCKKGLAYENMTEKQQRYVMGVYNTMKSVDSKDLKEESTVDKVDTDINNRYTLSEKPEILAKIQRLQKEVTALPALTEKIINTVMRSKFVSDKQIAQIDKAFNTFILNQDTPENDANTVTKKPVENKKWNLIERPDVKEKITAIQRHSDYTNIPDGVKNIFNNILKYNSVSEKQIATVDNTYRRYFGGR